jgi:hypothetical protein
MDYLDRLIELAWNASPVDRLRLERTIMLVMQAREIVLQHAGSNSKHGSG